MYSCFCLVLCVLFCASARDISSSHVCYLILLCRFQHWWPPFWDPSSKLLIPGVPALLRVPHSPMLSLGLIPNSVITLSSSSPAVVMALPQQEAHIAHTQDTSGAPGCGVQELLHFYIPEDVSCINPLSSRLGDIAVLPST